MSSARNWAELAEISPVSSKYGAVVVLRAFFDESGIHAGSLVTAICGFIGSRNQWRSVRTKWRKALGSRVFHYKNMRMEGALLDKLATILCNSELQVVSGGFVGNWERAIHSGASDWPIRFPSCYHMVMEMIAERLRHISEQQWGGEPIVMTFSRQDEYAKRVEEIWRTFKGNGFWPHITNLAYGSPEENFELETADMIAYETFQCLKEASTGGWAWNKWPLVRKLLDAGKPLHGFAQTEEQFVRMMSDMDKTGRRYLATVDKPKASGKKF